MKVVSKAGFALTVLVKVVMAPQRRVDIFMLDVKLLEDQVCMMICGVDLTNPGWLAWECVRSLIQH